MDLSISMKVIIARHAQTDENANNIHIGREVDVVLNAQGIRQAEQLAEFLKNEKIHVAYASPQTRARHTAQKVLKHHPEAHLIEVPDLREQHLGIYEGLGKAEWKEIKKNYTGPFHLFKPPQGESYTDLQERVKKFFDRLLQKHPNDTVLIVSHGGTLGMLFLHILNKELTEENYRQHKPENTALTIIEIDKDKPHHVHALNSLEHLKK
jgi:alpha-ribazole phosphatase